MQTCASLCCGVSDHTDHMSTGANNSKTPVKPQYNLSPDTYGAPVAGDVTLVGNRIPWRSTGQGGGGRPPLNHDKEMQTCCDGRQ